ncbi:MAG: hypothetical protein IJ407_01730 [Clostridia bacterium]|nr:hypothetical protein [Clostridia bacterium]
MANIDENNSAGVLSNAWSNDKNIVDPYEIETHKITANAKGNYHITVSGTQITMYPGNKGNKGMVLPSPCFLVTLI